MNQSNTRVGSRPFVAGEDLRGHEGRLVKVWHKEGPPEVALPSDEADLAVYVLLEGAAQGETTAVLPLSPERNVRVTLLGSCDAGAVLVLADPSQAEDRGKVRELPVDAGTYRGLLIAEEPGVNGQQVLARPAMLGLLVVG